MKGSSPLKFVITVMVMNVPYLKVPYQSAKFQRNRSTFFEILHLVLLITNIIGEDKIEIEVHLPRFRF